MDWGQVVVAGAAGGLCVGAGLGAAHMFGASKKTRSLVIALTAGLSVAAAGIANASGAGDWVNVTLGLKTRLEIETQKAGRLIVQHPRFKKLVEGKSVAEATQAIAQLSRSGLALLSDEELAEWASTNALLAERSAAFCAARWKGGMSRKVVEDALALAPEEAQQRWFRLSTRASLRALDDPNPPPEDPEAMPEGLAMIFLNLPPDQAQRAHDDAVRSDLTDARACELFKLVIRGAEELPDGQRERFIRGLSQL